MGHGPLHLFLLITMLYLFISMLLEHLAATCFLINVLDLSDYINIFFFENLLYLYIRGTERHLLKYGKFCFFVRRKKTELPYLGERESGLIEKEGGLLLYFLTEMVEKYINQKEKQTKEQKQRSQAQELYKHTTAQRKTTDL